MIVILLSFGKSGNLDWVSILIDLETGICMDDRIEIIVECTRIYPA